MEYVNVPIYKTDLLLADLEEYRKLNMEYFAKVENEDCYNSYMNADYKKLLTLAVDDAIFRMNILCREEGINV